MADIQKAEKPRTMRDWIESYRGKFEDAIPKNTIDVGRFITAAALEITSSQKLQMCSKESILRSLIDSAKYGLEVGRLLGQAWLIPYNESVRLPDGSWHKEMRCHFQLGYKGLIVLARRSNTIKTIAAETVYENDIIEVELGQGRHLTHKINIRAERGEPIAYYCLVELMNGGVQFSVLTKADAEKHRDKYSKAHGAKSTDDSVWDSNFDEMAMKTVVIRTLKLCPISIEALQATKIEELRGEGRPVDLTDTADTTPEPPDEGFAFEVEDEEQQPEPESKQDEPPEPKRDENPKKEAKTDFERSIERAKANARAMAGKHVVHIGKAAEFPAMQPTNNEEPEIF